jgi:hypothetical protein
MKPRIFRIVVPAVVLLIVSLSCIRIPHVRPDLEFSPDTLPEAQLGQSYSVDILVTRNETPMFQAGLADGALPAGLTIELLKQENIVRLSGTPAEAGTFIFSVGVACYGTNVNGQTGVKSYTLVVGR